MSCDSEVLLALEGLFSEGWISQVLHEVKSGKEATVYCCRGGERCEGRLIAAKVHRALDSRRFKNDAMYQTGRVHLAREGRVKRAADAKSSFGRTVQYATWLNHEWEIMRRLHEAGIDVPEPLARSERAILMPFLGDERGPAPQLIEAQLDRAQAESVTDALLNNIERMLDLHVVHGDLSPFNVLFWRGRAVIIDFPQAVDPRLNPAAAVLLARDIRNVCRWSARHGVDRDQDRIFDELWSRFVLGEIG